MTGPKGSSDPLITIQQLYQLALSEGRLDQAARRVSP